MTNLHKKKTSISFKSLDIVCFDSLINKSFILIEF
jgi:hypothetical protein